MGKGKPVVTDTETMPGDDLSCITLTRCRYLVTKKIAYHLSWRHSFGQVCKKSGKDWNLTTKLPKNCKVDKASESIC